MQKGIQIACEKMAIKQETVKLSISDDCNEHDDDVDGYDYENDKNVKNNVDDDNYDHNDYHDDDDDDDDDKVLTISKLNKSKPACQLLSSLMS